ncbi:MAG TPA: PAS domain S-box protein, partial [Spirochaetota bacterium]|nr:PAS domain S-box protein [Spirochaetota bacterium]
MSDTHILIIENDRLTSFDLRETLRRLGYRVADPVSSGTEGIARASELRPDLIILDIMLEGAPDGIETARRIKRLMDVPVIYITGQTSPQIFRRALETDPHGYLIKPFSTDDLHASIETAIRRSGLERKLRESENRFRSIIEQSRDSIVLTDEDGVIIEWNRAMEALSGLPRAEAVGQHIWDTMYRFLVEERKKPERLAQFKSLILELLRTGTPGWPEGTLENQYQSVNGTRHWLEGTLFPIETAKGHMLGYITRDMTERRQYEERLKQSEEKFRLQFKGIPVPTYIWEERHGEIVLAEYNDAADKITDGNISNFLGITVSRLYADLPDIEADIRRCHAEHETFEREMFYPFRSTGEKKYLIVKYAFLPPNQVLVHTQDITVRKQAEERIRESETRFRLAFENALDAMVWAEAETGILIHCNRAAEKLFGRNRNEMIGRHQTILHPPDKVNEVRNAFNRQAGGNPAPVEIDIITASGAIRNVSITTSRTEVEGKPVVQGIFRDITDSKKAEEALRQSEERYRTLFEESPEAIIVLGSDGIVRNINQSYTDLTGLTREEAVGTPFKDLPMLIPERLKDYNRMLAELIRGTELHRVEFPVRHRSGRTVYTEAYASRISVTPTETFLVTFRDITDRTMAEAALQEANELLEQRVRERTNELYKSNLQLWKEIDERRRAEIKLREGEEVARALINTPSEPVMLVSADGTIIDANHEIESRFGLSKERIIGRSMYEFGGVKNSERRMFKVDSVLSTGNVARFEERFGDEWYDTIIYPVPDHRGIVTKLAIFSHDITETRRMQRDIMEISALERQRIGQDLHDGLGQKLTGIAFLAEALKHSMKEKEYPELDDISEIIANIAESIDQARKIASGLWIARFESYDVAQA